MEHKFFMCFLVLISIIKDLSPLIIGILGVCLTYKFAIKKSIHSKRQDEYEEIYASMIDCAKALDKVLFKNPSENDSIGLLYREWYDEADKKMLETYHLYLKYSLFFTKNTDCIISDYLTNFVTFYNENKCLDFLTEGEEKNKKIKIISDINDKYIKQLLINETEINFNNELKTQMRKDLYC